METVFIGNCEINFARASHVLIFKFIISATMVQAWVMKDDVEDQRKPNQRNPNVPVSLEQLAELGVLYWHLDADK